MDQKTLIQVVALENTGIMIAYFALAIISMVSYIWIRNKVHNKKLFAVVSIFYVMFFVTCGITHMELAYHVLVDKPVWMLDWHFAVAHGLQLLSAIMAFILSIIGIMHEPWKGRF